MKAGFDTPILEVRGISKQFPGVRALSGVDLTLHHGEVLAVIGENGAGKSTLMKILAGVQRADRGQILLEGQEVSISSVRDASYLGIALIHQELNLCDNLDVGANIFLGREPLKRALIDTETIEHQSKAVLAHVGLDFDPRTPLNRLTIGHQQLVEIAKALSAEARILIMDEPTSSLSHHETEALFRVIRDLRSKGVSIVYISHRLGEVRTIADRVLVLRDGKNVGQLVGDDIHHDAMVRLMVGRELSRFYAHREHARGDMVMEVRDLVVPAHPRHRLSFTLHAGEIVGLAGLVGAGRTELLRVLFGIDPMRSGLIRVAREPLIPRSPLDAIYAGLALVPEDRKQQGLIIEMSIRHNVSLPGLRFQRRLLGLLNRRAEAHSATEAIQMLRIRTPGPDQIVQFLSGGNQQKVVLGKWLALRPRVLLMDEPTRGIDVGAKQEIYRLMEQLAEQGIAILFVSSDMEEILGISDRVLVMHQGELTGELDRRQLSEEAVMQLATRADGGGSDRRRVRQVRG